MQTESQRCQPPRWAVSAGIGVGKGSLCDPKTTLSAKRSVGWVSGLVGCADELRLGRAARVLASAVAAGVGVEKTTRAVVYTTPISDSGRWCRVLLAYRAFPDIDSPAVDPAPSMPAIA